MASLNKSLVLSDVGSSVLVLIPLQIDQKTGNKNAFVEGSMGVAEAVKMRRIISCVIFCFSSSKFLVVLQDFKLIYLPLSSSSYYFSGMFKK